MGSSTDELRNQLALASILASTGDPANIASGKILANDVSDQGTLAAQQLSEAQKEQLQAEREAAQDARQQRSLEAAETRADMRTSLMMGRWQLKRIPTPDGFKYVQQNSLTGEIRDPPTDLNQNASVGTKNKQDAAQLEAAADRIEALAGKATPEMFSRTNDIMADSASAIPVVGNALANMVKSKATPEKQQFRLQETGANAAVRRALDSGVGTDESRRIMNDLYPYSSGTNYEQFQTRAPAFVAQLRGLAAAKRNANYNPETGTGGSAPPTMTGIPSGGIPEISAHGGVTPTNAHSDASGASASGAVFERRNGKLVRVQ